MNGILYNALGICILRMMVMSMGLNMSNIMVKGSLGGETSVLRTFRMSGKEFVKERVSEGKS